MTEYYVINERARKIEVGDTVMRTNGGTGTYLGVVRLDRQHSRIEVLPDGSDKPAEFHPRLWGLSILGEYEPPERPKRKRQSGRHDSQQS